ncbi:MAG: FHA domain-containing protein, partial [bacterium]|nr:FHA domain-containing protein [bacterium]
MASDEDKTEIHSDTDFIQKPQQAESYPCLEVMSGARSGDRFPLKQGTTSFGRSKENDVILEDSSVSRQHVSVEISGDRIQVIDAGSRNGVRVNGEKISKPVVVGHEARIKIGIYECRLLTGPEGTKANPSPTAHKEPPLLTEEFEEGPIGMEDAPPEEEEIPQKRKVFDRKIIFISLAVFLVGVGGFFLSRFLGSGLKENPTEPKKPVFSGQARTDSMRSDAGQAIPQERGSAFVPVFLDLTASPLPADIYFGSQKMGTTPLRLPVTLEKKKIYEVRALFTLIEIGETLESTNRFSLPDDKQVLSIPFSARAGIFKITRVPRDATLYLEGFFERDPFRAKPIKMTDFVYGKPTYVPYGKYVLEMRRNRQLGQSQTFLDEVIYRREFIINEQQASFTVDVSEEDLRLFPISLNSTPSGADVYLGDEKVGQTPYEGTLPVGSHTLVLKKEGYFDYTQPVEVQVNMPYAVEVTLKTSEAGEKINSAREKIRNGLFDQAETDLVAALEKSSGPHETAQINYLLGIASLRRDKN